jgi:hypothetical protein
VNPEVLSKPSHELDTEILGIVWEFRAVGCTLAEIASMAHVKRDVASKSLQRLARLSRRVLFERENGRWWPSNEEIERRQREV